MRRDILTIYGRDGPTVIDSEYRDIGVREGWLVLHRVYPYLDGDVIVEYLLTPGRSP